LTFLDCTEWQSGWPAGVLVHVRRSLFTLFTFDQRILFPSSPSQLHCELSLARLDIAQHPTVLVVICQSLQKRSTASHRERPGLPARHPPLPSPLSSQNPPGPCRQLCPGSHPQFHQATARNNSSNPQTSGAAVQYCTIRFKEEVVCRLSFLPESRNPKSILHRLCGPVFVGGRTCEAQEKA
jgi:hypothetical protein